MNTGNHQSVYEYEFIRVHKLAIWVLQVNLIDLHDSENNYYTSLVPDPLSCLFAGAVCGWGRVNYCYTYTPQGNKYILTYTRFTSWGIHIGRLIFNYTWHSIARPMSLLSKIKVDAKKYHLPYWGLSSVKARSCGVVHTRYSLLFFFSIIFYALSKGYTK